MKRKSLFFCALLLIAVSLAGCGGGNAQRRNTAQPNQAKLTRQISDANAKPKQLAKLNYQPNMPDVIKVDHDRADLSKHMWKHDGAQYAKLDNLGRTSKGNTAELDKHNVANDSLRVRQTVKPTGYVQKFVGNNAVLNRGHEIAYSLSKGIDKKGKYNPKHQSGDQNNPRNLFAQTAFSNQELQTVYETKVRNAIRHGEKVVYRVHPIFQGRDEMPKGVQLEAISTNHKLDFNVYVFNVQPKLKFNYRTGQSSSDRAIDPKKLPGSPVFHDNNNGSFNRYPRRHHFIRHYAEYRLTRRMLRHHLYRRHYMRRPMRRSFKLRRIMRMRRLARMHRRF